MFSKLFGKYSTSNIRRIYFLSFALSSLYQLKRERERYWHSFSTTNIARRGNTCMHSRPLCSDVVGEWNNRTARLTLMCRSCYWRRHLPHPTFLLFTSPLFSFPLLECTLFKRARSGALFFTVSLGHERKSQELNKEKRDCDDTICFVSFFFFIKRQPNDETL